MLKISEGKAEITVPEGVFYNPKMTKLRDISIMFLKAKGCGEDTELLDCTAASGIRGIRYALEAGVKGVTLLDINEKAAKSSKANVARNKLKLTVLNESLQEFAGSHAGAFDAIDLDPFGTAVPYIHDLLKVSKDGTLLMITATDVATLCGAEHDACLRLYGSVPSHNDLCHEAGIRILLNYISHAAAQFNFGIDPELSISDMHYMRVFLTLKRGAVKAVESVKSTGFGRYCPSCRNFATAKGVISHLENRCPACGKEALVFGPLWLGSLYNKQTIGAMLNQENAADEARGLLERILAEIDSPFFYSVPKMTSYLKISSVPIDDVLGELSKKHKASRTHFNPAGIKTDASTKEVMAAVRKLAKARSQSPS